MTKAICFIIGLAALIFIGYKYFHLDKNPSFQQSVQNRDIDAAGAAARDAIGEKIAAVAKQFFYEHNNYFVSKSNNICTSLQGSFDSFKKIINNPVECSAQEHTFTARIKSGNSYYCSDISGIHTTGPAEPGYVVGVSCK